MLPDAWSFLTRLLLSRKCSRPAKDQILAQEVVQDDPLLIRGLSLQDGRPNYFWNSDVVRAACAKAVGSPDLAAFNHRLTSTRELMQAAADSGEDIHDLVLQLLSREDILEDDVTFRLEDDVTFRWAATSSTLLKGTASTQQDLGPLRLRAEAVRDKRGANSLGLSTSPFSHASRDSLMRLPLDTFTSELTAWMSSVPLDPSNELGDWFPELRILEARPSRSLCSLPRPLSSTSLKLRPRLRFARQQNVSWTDVGHKIVELLCTPPGAERATLLAQESIAENQGTVPGEFYEHVSNALLDFLYDRGKLPTLYSSTAGTGFTLTRTELTPRCRREDAPSGRSFWMP